MKKIFTALLLSLLCAGSASAARMRITVPETAPVGQPFFFELRASEDIGDVTVTWRGKNYILKPRLNTVRTILGIPNDAKLAGQSFPLTVEFDCGEKGRIQAERTVTAAAHNYPRQELKVAPKMVTPPKSEENRIAKERKLVSQAISARTKALPLPKTFVRPVAGIPTAYFGGFRVYNGVPRSGHGGLDLRAATGTSVKCIADGKVVLTGEHYFSGGAVYVDHGGGMLSAYFHLSKILVKKGQTVKAGDIIARSGATGRVTGPHLHLGIYAGGAWLDALPLLGEAKLPEGVETFYEF